MTDISKEAVEWPREIWMKERDDHDQGLFYGVLSVFATVDREEEFNRYIDANIYDSAEKYHAARYDAQAARIAELEAALLKISRHDVPPVGYFNGRCAHGLSVDVNCHSCTKDFALSLIDKEPTP